MWWFRQKSDAQKKARAGVGLASLADRGQDALKTPASSGFGAFGALTSSASNTLSKTLVESNPEAKLEQNPEPLVMPLKREDPEAIENETNRLFQPPEVVDHQLISDFSDLFDTPAMAVTPKSPPPSAALHNMLAMGLDFPTVTPSLPDSIEALMLSPDAMDDREALAMSLMPFIDQETEDEASVQPLILLSDVFSATEVRQEASQEQENMPTPDATDDEQTMYSVAEMADFDDYVPAGVSIPLAADRPAVHYAPSQNNFLGNSLDDSKDYLNDPMNADSFWAVQASEFPTSGQNPPSEKNPPQDLENARENVLDIDLSTLTRAAEPSSLVSCASFIPIWPSTSGSASAISPQFDEAGFLSVATSMQSRPVTEHQRPPDEPSLSRASIEKQLAALFPAASSAGVSPFSMLTAENPPATMANSPFQPTRLPSGLGTALQVGQGGTIAPLIELSESYASGSTLLAAGTILLEQPLALPYDMVLVHPEYRSRVLQLVSMPKTTGTPKPEIRLVWKPAESKGYEQIVQAFEETPLTSSHPRMVVAYQATLGNKHLFQVTVGQWSAVLRVDEESVRVHTVL